MSIAHEPTEKPLSAFIMLLDCLLTSVVGGTLEEGIVSRVNDLSCY
jgi:hypothetical protein